MKQKQTRKLLSLFLSLVMLMALAVPAFADDGDGNEGPAKEIKAMWLDWDDEGRNFASDDLLAAADRGEGGGFRLAPGNEARVIFFIWNHETQKREKFVVPEAGEGVSVEKLASDEIVRGAKQSQYYVRVTLDGWEGADLTADGLTFHVDGGMDWSAFFTSQKFSQETYLSNEVNEETLADRTVYFGNSYAGTDEAGENDKVVSVEKMENGHENLYTVEKVSDNCWKIVYQDVFAVWGNIGVQLKLEVLQPDGETREEDRWLWIVHETAPQLQFVWIDSEWSEKDQLEYFYFNPGRRDCTTALELQPGNSMYGILGYGGDWDENGFNMDGFTPVSVKDVKLPDGVTANTDLPVKQGAQWSEYYVELSSEAKNKTFTATYGEYELTINCRLPDIGVYTAPKATWKNWAGPWGFPFNAVLDDNEYYIISTASDAVHGRHLTGMALSEKPENENEFANGDVELSKVSDGVYKLTLKDGALKRDWFHLELDYDWTDVAGNTYTDSNSYLGNFDNKGAVVAAETPLYDCTSVNVMDAGVPAADAKDKVTISVTMKAGEDKVLYLYRSGYRYSAGPVVSCIPLPGFFYSNSKDLTLTQDETDVSKFTLNCAKAGVYQIYIQSENYDWDNFKLFHADGTQYTQEEAAKFNEEVMYDVINGVLVVYDEDWNSTPFEEKFPGETYELKSLGLMDWEFTRLTVTVEQEFVDVKSGNWFYTDVNYVSSNGLMNGTGETTFAPNGTVKREMVPTVLYRLDGAPSVKAGSFTDVAGGKWYTDAITWGAENEIVKGMGNGTFGVGSNITREQLATMLYRYAEYKGCDMTASGDLSGFADAKDVHDWARTAMQWAVGAGIINGKGGSLVPQGEASRAELATMLARFCRDVL